eukprot:484098_1
MSQYDRNHRPYRSQRAKPNIYEKRLSAQRRNKMYKHQHRRNDNYYPLNTTPNNDNDNYPNECDSNESVDSSKKINQLRHEIASIFIPTDNKNEIYDLNGHIMYLIPVNTINNFNLQQFITTLTSRQCNNVIERAKLLKVEIINNNNELVFKLCLTVSSP